MSEPPDRQRVEEALTLFASRLDPIIAAQLSDVLGGLPWTSILEQLDQMKGYTPKTYTTGDPQAQLRMITEKLGALGFPFEKSGSREVSTLGSELRIVRNRWAHNDEFTALDVFRTDDFACRLLGLLGDEPGLTSFRELRREALAAAAQAEGIDPADIEAKRGDVAVMPRPAEPVDDVESELVVPDPAVLVRGNAASTPMIGGARSEFVPWAAVRAGDVSVLDGLAKKQNKQRMRAVAVEIAEFEGPIHLDRLADLVAESFNLQRLHLDRKHKIVYQIRHTGLLVDPDSFVWPSTIDPDVWTEFRPNDSDANRPFWQISPVEIANAIDFLRATQPSLTQSELETATLQTFGRRRRTQRLGEYLARAMKVADGRVRG